MLFRIVIVAIITNVNIVSGQPEKKQQNQIPENINKIFEASCMSCHGKKGGRLPKSKLNFSRWASYGATKEAEKASMICKAVSNGKMPPKSARESTPGLIPSSEQIDMLCKWAESYEPMKEKK